MAINFNSKPGFVFGASASNVNRNFIENSFDRSSTGKRIKSAADDAAGLEVLSKLEAALSGKEQAIKNAADGQGLLHTAEAGVAKISNILNRMRELAVQAANGTNSIAEREALQSEADQLTAEISRIADGTYFNGRAPLSGVNVNVQEGASLDENIPLTIHAVGSSDLQLDEGRVSFDTVANARDAIGILDAALEKLIAARSDIGSSMNRISSSIYHLSSFAKNTISSASLKSDLDVEDETTRLIKSQILQQSSNAMLAQGNASKGMMLYLI
tara:strand:- start:8 stop:823 length:816 start_codon:yes stop_codon:yes gene_type:complete